MSEAITIYTIGFTKKSAEEFFGLLRSAGVQRMIDVRLNNVSQLAGFAKRDDLAFFLKEIGGIDYVHKPELAPSKELLDAYKKGQITWEAYERQFVASMAADRIERHVSRESLDRACLLCSEAEPECCHRRLVAEHLARCWDGVRIEHLT
jgi:uncharacterized protein (DUF488 family)